MTTPSEPFSHLVELARRSRAAARGLPAQVNITPHWSGIGFNLLGMRMVAPMGSQLGQWRC
jgi:twitching motility protein PilI